MSEKDKTVRRSRFEKIDNPYQYWKDEFDALEEVFLERREKVLGMLEDLIQVTWEIGRAEVLRDRAQIDEVKQKDEKQGDKP